MKKTIGIIGGGSAALFLAAHLDESLFDIHIYEKNAALGRKFLVAGQGGFNLTHSEAADMMVSRYSPSLFLRESILQFSNTQFIKFLSRIGIDTYTGTSKRIFPVKGIKPVDVLNAVLELLKRKGVKIHTGYHWKGFHEDNSLIFETESGQKKVEANSFVFALGGASWKVTGSDGGWLPFFEQKGIKCIPFQPSNCAFGIKWPESIINKIKGSALKNCIFSSGQMEVKGEAVLTEFGIEGSGVYPLSGSIREQLEKENEATISIDLKPQLSFEELKERILKHKGSLSAFLEKEIKLNKAVVLLLKTVLNKEEYTNADKLSSKIKCFDLNIVSLAPIDEAISTVGGIALEEVNEHFELNKLPDHYVIGEMLDWDAPTGGYLLQACYSMGAGLAKYLNN